MVACMTFDFLLGCYRTYACSNVPIHAENVVFFSEFEDVALNDLERCQRILSKSPALAIQTHCVSL